MKKIFLFFWAVSFSFALGFPEYYYEIKDGKKQREEFVNILRPLLQNANDKALFERNFLANFFENAQKRGFREFDAREIRYLIDIAKKYKITKLFDKEEFLKRVDVVPVSLGLTQGAIESGWGKSRFVREANNIFGHWTWGEHGLIPEDREEGKNHKIRIFASLQDSVDAYVLNLNRNYAYNYFRELRQSIKSKGKSFTGVEAATTMVNYSELRDEYINMLKGIMEANNLLRYDGRAYNPASLIASD